jgi:lipopolysaccharide/colanic/teichoic acid biosynthesis glycosyltransferase
MLDRKTNTDENAAPEHPAVAGLVRRLLAAAHGGRALMLGVRAAKVRTKLARELATALARRGDVRVLLVSNRHDEHPGWHEFARGEADLSAATQASTASALRLMPAGAATDRPPRLDDMRAALETIERQFEFVVFDLGLAATTHDGLVKLLDGVVLVLPGPNPSRDDARRAKRKLQRAGARLLGVVLEHGHDGDCRQVSGRKAAAAAAAERAGDVSRLLGADARISHAATVPLSTTAFRRALEVERIRADRTRTGFSLLLFTPSDEQRDEDHGGFFLSVQERLRISDVPGTWDDHRSAVLLPDTDEAGACTLADDLSRRLRVDGIDGRFKVYSHPPKWHANGHAGEDSGPSSNGDRRDSDHRNGDSPPNGYASIHEPLQTESGSTTKAERNDAPAFARASAVPMEFLLARPLPIWKRWIDICGASLGLVLLLPVLCLAAAAIKLTSRGPVFYRQLRSGLGGRPFRMVKFRTMCQGADRLQAELRDQSEQDGPAFKLRSDPRVTRVGRFLRKTSIDELPQLWNVLKGEMTLVGPRPLPCDEARACQPWQRRRLSVTPGLTCFWQVEGRSQVTFDDWMRADLRYVRRRSLWTDLSLILRTIPAVLRGRGAH